MAAPVYEYEGLHEFEEEAAHEAHELSHEASHELSPVRKIYQDAFMEHLAHEVAEAESEQEAAEGFLPLIPMIASKLLPLAAKAIPKVAKLLPKVTKAVNQVTPQLTRGVSQITRALFRDPRTRPLVRTIPSIARRTVANIARKAATGQTVTPRTAVRTLAQQARTVLKNPRHRALAIRRSQALDRHAHKISGTPAPRVSVNVSAARRGCGGGCGCASWRVARPCCRCCGQLLR